jgi:hypothetical protein
VLRSRTEVTANSQLTWFNQSYFTTGGLPPISSSWRQDPWDPQPVFVFQLNTLGYSPYVTSSLMRGWVCRLQFVMALASAVILESEPSGTHDHILHSQIRNSPNLEGQVPVFIFPRNRVAQLYPQALGSLFVASYDSQGYGGGIRPRLHTVTDFFATPRHGARGRHRSFPYANRFPLPRERVHRAVAQKLISWSLHSSSYTRYNMKALETACFEFQMAPSIAYQD